MRKNPVAFLLTLSLGGIRIFVPLIQRLEEWDEKFELNLGEILFH